MTQTQTPTPTTPTAPAVAPWAAAAPSAAPAAVTPPAAPDAVKPPADAPGTELAKPNEVADELVDSVIVSIPKAFQLRTDANTVKQFKPGVQDMLRVDAEHWYSVANGVTIYKPKA